MNITRTLYVRTRAEWRSWLKKHHRSAKEIWLIYYKKASNKPRIPYTDAVDEALCFGWIDGIVKGIDGERYAQRFTPRNEKSSWSAANTERVRNLRKAGKMTEAGLLAFRRGITQAKRNAPKAFPPDILAAIRKNPLAWANFSKFASSYRRVRIGWIESARRRPEVFRQRLRYFIRMTERGKTFGLVR